MSAGLPKPHVELVVSLAGVHWWRAAPGACEHRFRDAWITPLQQAPRYARSIGKRRLIGARLEPWAATLLFPNLPRGDGTPPVPLARFFGRDVAALRRRLREACTEARLFDMFAEWLTARFPRPLLARSPLEGIASPRIASPRTVRRHFTRHVGVSPKQWQLLRRLDAILRDPALGDRGRPLASLAYEHGFADQAHFGKEVMRLTGVTPGRLRARPAAYPPHLLRLS